MQQSPTPTGPITGALLDYSNVSLHTGQNSRLNGRLLTDTESIELLNVDITVPGIRTKKRSPELVSTLGGASDAVTGMITRSILGANATVISIKGGTLWESDGSTDTQYTGATIDSISLSVLQQAMDVIYGTDGINPVYRFDGTTLAPTFIYAADGVTRMEGVQAMVYYLERMWYTIGDYIYFSDVGNPEQISEAPLFVRRGAGDSLIQLIGYRDQYLIAVKGGTSGLGSLNLFYVASNEPDSFQQSITPLFETLSIPAARKASVRLSSNSDADVLYYTAEGLRSLNFTALDKFTGPSLPITYLIPDVIDVVNYSAAHGIHLNVFDDEILLWLPTGTNLFPSICVGNTRKIPGNASTNGWVKYDMMNATCSTVAALDVDDNPQLYIGTSDGKLQRAFSVADETNTYREIGKRITYEQPYQDKGPLKFALQQQIGGTGSVAIYLLFEDDESRPLGNQSFDDGGFDIPFSIPFDIAAANISTDFRDIHFDSDGIRMRRGKDMRVKIEGTGQPRILGYLLQCTIEQDRYVELNRTILTPSVATNLTEVQLAATDYNG